LQLSEQSPSDSVFADYCQQQESDRVRHYIKRMVFGKYADKSNVTKAEYDESNTTLCGFPSLVLPQLVPFV
jgi:hypothetical protein